MVYGLWFGVYGLWCMVPPVINDTFPPEQTGPGNGCVIDVQGYLAHKKLPPPRATVGP